MAESFIETVRLLRDVLTPEMLVKINSISDGTKQLSSNDFTDGEKAKLENLANYTHPTKHPASIIDGSGNAGKVLKVDGAGMSGFDDISWSEVQGKPSTFTPSAHEHDYSPVGHTHPYAAQSHNHDTRYPVLNGSGKIDPEYFSTLLTNQVFRASSEANMLLLSDVGVGDECIRTDLPSNNVYKCIQTPATDINNWARLLNGGASVISVNGAMGDVVIDAQSLGLGDVDNTADLDKPISHATALALDGKASSSHTHANYALTATVDALKDGSTKTIKNLDDSIATIATLLTSNDVSLDTVQEIVNYIKSEQSLIDTLSTNKVNKTDIVDALTSTLTNAPLSANQGKVLKTALDALTATVNNNAAIQAAIITSIVNTSITVPDNTNSLVVGNLNLAANANITLGINSEIHFV